MSNSSTIWLSHTSISNFLNCPRGYFLKHIYRNPKTNRKIKLITPALALGQTVHKVLEDLSYIAKDERFSKPLIDKYEVEWQKVSGKSGGFFDEKTEEEFKKRGEEMLAIVQKNPGPLKRTAVKITEELPHFWLSEKDGLYLCGKIDWLEYISSDDSIKIIDFKTGKKTEDESSLQLPIYYLIAKNSQKRKVSAMAYWYLTLDDGLVNKDIPDYDKVLTEVQKIGRKIKLCHQLNNFVCPKSGCFCCSPMEKIISGKAEYVGLDEYGYENYILNDEKVSDENDSYLL